MRLTLSSCCASVPGYYTRASQPRGWLAGCHCEISSARPRVRASAPTVTRLAEDTRPRGINTPSSQQTAPSQCRGVTIAFGPCKPCPYVCSSVCISRTDPVLYASALWMWMIRHDQPPKGMTAPFSQSFNLVSIALAQTVSSFHAFHQRPPRRAVKVLYPGG